MQKPSPTPPDLRFELPVEIGWQSRPRKKAEPSLPAAKPPSVRTMFLLAHKIQAMVEAGEAGSFSEVARRFGVTTTRMSHLVNLTLLAPEIKAYLLTAPDKELTRLKERHLRPIGLKVSWEEQVGLWKRCVSRQET